jgi:hypothetical protein
MKFFSLMIVVGSTYAFAGGVADKKERDAIDAQAAKAAADIKDCGTKFTVTFDWKAFDGLEWDKMHRKRKDYIGTEKSNLVELGHGLNRLCADNDYKAALVKVTNIVYRSTNDDKIKLKATVSGGTLTISNYSFGSTRSANDYETAVKATL